MFAHSQLPLPSTATVQRVEDTHGADQILLCTPISGSSLPSIVVVVIVIIIIIIIIIVVVVVGCPEVAHDLDVDHGGEHEVDGGGDHEGAKREEGEHARVAAAADLNHFLPSLLLLLMSISIIRSH